MQLSEGQSTGLRRPRPLPEMAARWRCGSLIKNLTLHYHSQFCVSLNFFCNLKPSGGSKSVKMGINITMFFSKTYCLDLLYLAGLVYLTYMLESHVMPTPPLPTHLVMHYTFQLSFSSELCCSCFGHTAWQVDSCEHRT